MYSMHSCSFLMLYKYSGTIAIQHCGIVLEYTQEKNIMQRLRLVSIYSTNTRTHTHTHTLYRNISQVLSQTKYPVTVVGLYYYTPHTIYTLYGIEATCRTTDWT